MADQSGGLSIEERIEIDGFFDRLSTATHYELLGIDLNAEPRAIEHAFKMRLARFQPGSFSNRLTPQYQQRIDAIFRALNEAHAVLSDPIRRYLYDQDVASRKPTSTPARPRTHSMPAPPIGQPPRAHTSIAPPEPIAPLQPRAPTPPADARAPNTASDSVIPPPPPRRPITAPYNTTHGTTAPASIAPTDASADARVQALEAQVAALKGDVALLLSEVERLAVSVQLSIAWSIEPESVRREQLVNAGQALVSTRVAATTALARREEKDGHWDTAAALWQRAAKARPGEVMLFVRAADALRKAATDLPTAKALARQAIEIDPDCAEAHTALALIEARRKHNP